MKKTIFFSGIVVLVIAAVLYFFYDQSFGIIAKKLSKAGVNSDEIFTYRSPKYNFEISYPMDWDATTWDTSNASSSKMLFTYGGKNGEKDVRFYVLFLDLREKNATSETLKAWMSRDYEIKDISEETVLIGNEEGKIIKVIACGILFKNCAAEFRYRSSSTLSKGFQFFGSIAYWGDLSSSVSFEPFAEDIENFKKALQTFHYIDPNSSYTRKQFPSDYQKVKKIFRDKELGFSVFYPDGIQPDIISYSNEKQIFSTYLRTSSSTKLVTFSVNNSRQKIELQDVKTAYGLSDESLLGHFRPEPKEIVLNNKKFIDFRNARCLSDSQCKGRFSLISEGGRQFNMQIDFYDKKEMTSYDPEEIFPDMVKVFYEMLSTLQEDN